MPLKVYTDTESIYLIFSYYNWDIRQYLDGDKDECP